jgi:hypothetical protein
MKKHILLFVLCIQLSVASTLVALEPAAFDKMLRGYCFAGNKVADPKAFGGYGRSNNFPQALGADGQPAASGLYLEIIESEKAVFDKVYEGIFVRLVNNGEHEVTIPASDSRIAILQEAMDSNGEWNEIEYLPRSWCGSSYHNVYLMPGNFWSFNAPKYSGPQKTSLRFKLTLSENEILYTESYAGGIHPAQFSQQAGHNSAGIMDPYNE